MGMNTTHVEGAQYIRGRVCTPLMQPGFLRFLHYRVNSATICRGIPAVYIFKGISK